MRRTSCPLRSIIGHTHFDEAVAAIALEHAGTILGRSRAIIKQNLAVLDAWIATEPHLSYIKPEAGTTALVYYDYAIDSYAFCTRMIEKTGAMVTPGDCFEEPRSMRIGYGYSDNPEDLKKGLEAISRYLRTLE